MRIHRLHLQHVAGVDDRELRFGDHVTVVVGPNEAGKSTIPTALQLLLEEKDRYDNERIRTVRPVHVDADPTIELEATTGPYHLTYRKVFGRSAGRRETSLTVHGPRHESLTGDRAHDRMTEILAETVDEQLWAALRVAQGHDTGQVDLTGAGSLMAALDAAGGGTGDGTDDDTLIARVEEEAAVHWTSQGRPRRPLLEADEAVEQARRALDEATDELALVARATQRHDELVDQVARWRAELPQLERRAKETAAALAELTAQRDAVDAAEGVVERARATVTDARDARHDRSVLVQRIADGHEVLADAREAVEHASRALTAAERDVTDARVHRDAVRVEVDRCRRLVAAAQEDSDLLRLEREVVHLTARLTEAQQLHDRREEARSTLATPAPSPAQVRRLETLEADVRTAAALLEAGVPHVRITGPVGTPLTVDRAGHVLGGDELDVAVAAETTVTVGDVALTVTPGASANELADRLDAARRALADALDELDVADLSAARARREAARAAQQALDATTDAWQRVQQVDGIAGLRSSLERTERRIAELRADRDADRPLPDDEDTATDALTARRAELAAAETTLTTADEAVETATRTASNARNAVATASARLEDRQDRLDELTERLEAARQRIDDDALESAVAAAEESLAAATTAHEQARRLLASMDAATLEADAEAAAARLRSTTQWCIDAEREQARVWGSIETSARAGLGEQVVELEAALAEATAARDVLRRKAEALLLLRDTLRAHRDDARLRYRAPLRARIEELGRVVFGRDLTVTLDDQLRIDTRTLDGRTLALSQLSDGTKEQLAIIARLAAATLVDERDGVPVILDDALGYADPTRTDRMNTLLGRAGEDTQVIVLTCDPDRFAAVPAADVVRLG